VFQVLSSANIDYWIDGGTLLGQIRNKKFIAHDLDGDIGMVTRSLNLLRRTDLRDQLAPNYLLEVTNSSIYAAGLRGEALPARVIDITSGLYVDVFEYPAEVILGREFLSPVPSICWWMCARYETSQLWRSRTHARAGVSSIRRRGSRNWWRLRFGSLQHEFVDSKGNR
jgi:hypothetical protein